MCWHLTISRREFCDKDIQNEVRQYDFDETVKMLVVEKRSFYLFLCKAHTRRQHVKAFPINLNWANYILLHRSLLLWRVTNIKSTIKCFFVVYMRRFVTIRHLFYMRFAAKTSNKMKRAILICIFNGFFIEVSWCARLL